MCFLLVLNVEIIPIHFPVNCIYIAAIWAPVDRVLLRNKMLSRSRSIFIWCSQKSMEISCQHVFCFSLYKTLVDNGCFDHVRNPKSFTTMKPGLTLFLETNISIRNHSN